MKDVMVGIGRVVAGVGRTRTRTPFREILRKKILKLWENFVKESEKEDGEIFGDIG